MYRNTRTAHCPDCCIPGGKAGWSRDWDNNGNPLWRCENCGTRKPVHTRKTRTLVEKKMEAITVPVDTAYDYGYSLAKEANATDRQAVEVGRTIRTLVEMVVLADGDTAVHMTCLSLYPVGQKLMVYAYGVCSASHEGTTLEAWGRRLNGVIVGARGGLTHRDCKTDKRTRGWRAVYAAL